MFRQFTHLNVLKACGVALLEQLFDRFRPSIGAAELTFPSPGSGEADEKEYYKALLQVFREPERLPGDLCEVLYEIDALANAESADRLTFVADVNKIPLLGIRRHAW